MPATFPAYATLLREGYMHDRASAVGRSPMEDGMVKQMKKQSAVLMGRPVTYGFKTKADYLSFITFHTTTINRGNDWFNWTDPVDAVVKLARIVNGKIKEEPDDPMLTYWKVSFNIETWV